MHGPCMPARPFAILAAVLAVAIATPLPAAARGGSAGGGHAGAAIGWGGGNRMAIGHVGSRAGFRGSRTGSDGFRATPRGGQAGASLPSAIVPPFSGGPIVPPLTSASPAPVRGYEIWHRAGGSWQRSYRHDGSSRGLVGNSDLPGFAAYAEQPIAPGPVIQVWHADGSGSWHREAETSPRGPQIWHRDADGNWHEER